MAMGLRITSLSDLKTKVHKRTVFIKIVFRKKHEWASPPDVLSLWAVVETASG